MSSEGTNYYRINGEIAICRRCKRKRTMEESMDDLQFKTCHKCRVAERDQKNQLKRKYNDENEPPMDTDRDDVPFPSTTIQTTPLGVRNMNAVHSNVRSNVHFKLTHSRLPSAPGLHTEMTNTQKETFRTNFLHNLTYSQQFINTFDTMAALRPSQCLNCSCELLQYQTGKQLCGACELKDSVIRDFDLYLSIMKVNHSSDLYKVIFMTQISVDSLIKSSFMKDNCRNSILRALYSKFILPINIASGAEFIYMSFDPPRVNPISGQQIESPFIKVQLKCARDQGTRPKIPDELIDDALKQDGCQPALVPHNCHSLIRISYDLIMGSLVICYSHKATKMVV